LLVTGLFAAQELLAQPDRGSTARLPVVLTETPAGGQPRLLLLDSSGAARVLTQGFFAAADPAVSWDARRILFAGRKTPSEPWQIYEMTVATGAVRQLTRMSMDCRQPAYQSKIFSLDIPDPWPQAAFICGGALYTVKFDGTLRQRITFTPWEESSPAMLPDGMMVFSSKQGSRTQLMAVNLDGTDYSLYVPGEQLREPAATLDGRLVFVEGEGALAAVDLVRPLYTKRLLTKPGDGIYSSPSPLPGGRLLVTWQKDAASPAGVYRFNPANQTKIPVYVKPGVSAAQAKALLPRPEPDGRGSVVIEDAGWSRLYCLSIFTTDRRDLIRPGAEWRLRVYTGSPSNPLKIGDLRIEDDGSFHLDVPPNTPLKMELVNRAGQVVRSSSWVYTRPKENRGCIGCHEDPELTPENREAKAVIKKPVKLTAPAILTNGGSR
jgi:hypothetical protein